MYAVQMEALIKFMGHNWTAIENPHPERAGPTESRRHTGKPALPANRGYTPIWKVIIAVNY